MIEHMPKVARPVEAFRELGAQHQQKQPLGGTCRPQALQLTPRRFSCTNPTLSSSRRAQTKPRQRRSTGASINPNPNPNQALVVGANLLRHHKLLNGGKQPIGGGGGVAARPSGLVAGLPRSVREYLLAKMRLTNCSGVHICDGSAAERDWLIGLMREQKIIVPLDAAGRRPNCWLARTDPRDVARVEARTFVCTRNKRDVVPAGRAPQPGQLANWLHVDELDARMATLLANCMAGRLMFVIPFSMGPLGSPLARLGVQLTDSAYVVASMHIMTRVSRDVLQMIERADADAGATAKENEARNLQEESGGSGGSSRPASNYVKCFHSVGCPLPLERPLVNHWPCNPDATIISHVPERNEILSYGSGYGGNSLLGKKCLALRLGSHMGRREGWLAEHMLILGLTNGRGEKKYVAAAFPSACGKTNLAMMQPALANYKVECVGDDIAWMRFDPRDGRLRAINPEAGFFGVAPGTCRASNPNAMRTIDRNTLFTNVAQTQDGDFFWEGLEGERNVERGVIDWQGKAWQPDCGRQAAHPNSRFCAPAAQCPTIDPAWESPEGVPISAIIFGGRRPEGVPLVYESLDWQHGVFLGASMRSEATAAAEHQGKRILHDPFAMRPFLGYNFGHYLDHWLSFGRNPKLQLPKIFHVNWFRKHPQSGRYLWPGFGENARVLDWICRRVDGEQCARATPIGLVPARGALNLEGLAGEPVDWEQLFAISSDFWLAEQQLIEHYLRDNVGADLPAEILTQCRKLRERLLASRSLEEAHQAS